METHATDPNAHPPAGSSSVDACVASNNTQACSPADQRNWSEQVLTPGDPTETEENAFDHYKSHYATPQAGVDTVEDTPVSLKLDVATVACDFPHYEKNFDISYCGKEVCRDDPLAMAWLDDVARLTKEVEENEPGCVRETLTKLDLIPKKGREALDPAGKPMIDHPHSRDEKDQHVSQSSSSAETLPDTETLRENESKVPAEAEADARNHQESTLESSFHASSAADTDQTGSTVANPDVCESTLPVIEFNDFCAKHDPSNIINIWKWEQESAGDILPHVVSSLQKISKLGSHLVSLCEIIEGIQMEIPKRIKVTHWPPADRTSVEEEAGTGVEARCADPAQRHHDRVTEAVGVEDGPASSNLLERGRRHGTPSPRSGNADSDKKNRGSGLPSKKRLRETQGSDQHKRIRKEQSSRPAPKNPIFIDLTDSDGDEAVPQ